jgi:hypothetical protein
VKKKEEARAKVKKKQKSGEEGCTTVKRKQRSGTKVLSFDDCSSKAAVKPWVRGIVRFIWGTRRIVRFIWGTRAIELFGL